MKKWLIMVLMISIVLGSTSRVYAVDLSKPAIEDTVKPKMSDKLKKYYEVMDIDKVKNRSLIYRELTDIDRQVLDIVIDAIMNMDRTCIADGDSTRMAIFIRYEFPELVHLKSVACARNIHTGKMHYSFSYYNQDEYEAVADSIVGLIVKSREAKEDRNPNYRMAMMECVVDSGIEYESGMADMHEWSKRNVGNCQVYTKLYNILLRYGNIEASHIIGDVTETESHMWSVYRIPKTRGVVFGDATASKHYVSRKDMLKTITNYKGVSADALSKYISDQQVSKTER